MDRFLGIERVEEIEEITEENTNDFEDVWETSAQALTVNTSHKQHVVIDYDDLGEEERRTLLSDAMKKREL